MKSILLPLLQKVCAEVVSGNSEIGWRMTSRVRSHSFINTMPKDTPSTISLVTFRDALADLEEPPFCTGPASLNANNSVLFYRAGNSPFAKYFVDEYGGERVYTAAMKTKKRNSSL